MSIEGPRGAFAEWHRCVIILCPDSTGLCGEPGSVAYHLSDRLGPQLLTHLSNLSITASRLLSHHTGLYVTPTSRYAVGSREATRGSTLGMDTLFTGAHSMNSDSR